MERDHSVLQNLLAGNPLHRLRGLVAQAGKPFPQSDQSSVIFYQTAEFLRLTPPEHIHRRGGTVTVVLPMLCPAELLPCLQKQIALAGKIDKRRKPVGLHHILIGKIKRRSLTVHGEHQLIPQGVIVMG